MVRRWAGLAEHPPDELGGPMGVSQALLALRFLPLDGELGERIRRALDGYVLDPTVEGRRYGVRVLPSDLLSDRGSP